MIDNQQRTCRQLNKFDLHIANKCWLAIINGVTVQIALQNLKEQNYFSSTPCAIIPAKAFFTFVVSDLVTKNISMLIKLNQSSWVSSKNHVPLKSVCTGRISKFSFASHDVSKTFLFFCNIAQSGCARLTTGALWTIKMANISNVLESFNNLRVFPFLAKIWWITWIFVEIWIRNYFWKQFAILNQPHRPSHWYCSLGCCTHLGCAIKKKYENSKF